MSEPWKVLFVDDDRDFLAAQSAFFGSRGHVVHTAASTEEALRLLEDEVPDIIFLDLMMERYDSGFRLAHQIRKQERLKDTPLVMLSAVAAATGERFDQEDRPCAPGRTSTASWTSRPPASSCWAWPRNSWGPDEHRSTAHGPTRHASAGAARILVVDDEYGVRSGHQADPGDRGLRGRRRRDRPGSPGPARSQLRTTWPCSTTACPTSTGSPSCRPSRPAAPTSPPA